MHSLEEIEWRQQRRDKLQGQTCTSPPSTERRPEATAASSGREQEEQGGNADSLDRQALDGELITVLAFCLPSVLA